MIDLRNLFHRSTPSPPDAFGFAVVGLGRIAEHFLKALADSPVARVTALVSGDAKKAARLAKQYSVPHTCGYDDVEALRERPDVHAVYLALPVGMHREYTARAARAGKHVLCEKPMANTAEESRAMIQSCRDAGVLLAIAYPCPHDPLYGLGRELVRTGALGTLHRMTSQFSFTLAADDWRRDAKLAGGGSLYDLGIYSLNAARFFLGEEPTHHEATAVTDSHGLELAIDWTSHWAGGVAGEFRSSYIDAFRDTFSLEGTGGQLTLSPAFSHRERFRLRGSIIDPATGKRIEIDEKTPDSTPSHFRLEAEHLVHCARNGTPLLTPGEDGLRDMEAMAAIYAAADVAT